MMKLERVHHCLFLALYFLLAPYVESLSDFLTNLCFFPLPPSFSIGTWGFRREKRQPGLVQTPITSPNRGDKERVKVTGKLN